MWLTRKLLRDWKQISKHHDVHGHSAATRKWCSNGRHDGGYYKEYRYSVRPQDSNLHVWHLLLANTVTGREYYLVLYIREKSFTRHEDRDVHLFLKCLTPTAAIPLSRTISLMHLYSVLVYQGFTEFIGAIIDTIIYGNDNSGGACTRLESKIMYVWNRIAIKTFKSQFPESLGRLESGDYTLIKDFCKSNNLSMNITHDIVEFAREGGKLSAVIACDEDILRPNNPQHFNCITTKRTIDDNDNKALQQKKRSKK